MENLLTEFGLPTFLATPIVVILSLIALVALYKIIKGLTFKFLGCPLNRACKYVTTKLGISCGCNKSCKNGSCEKTCSGPCLPVKIVLYVIALSLTFTAFGIIAGFFGLTGVAGILTAIVGVVGAIISWVTGVVKEVLILIPQAIAVYFAGRSIYKGPETTLTETKSFVTTNVKGLFDKAVEGVDSASDSVADKINL